MNIDRKHHYIALVVVGLALVAGPAFGLRMRSDAKKYKRLSGNQEKKIAELQLRLAEMKITLDRQDKTVADQQKRNGELSKAHHELRKRNETLLLEINEAKRQTQELMTGKKQLASRMDMIAAEAEELAKAKAQLSGQIELISAEADELEKAKKEREEALRNQQKLIESLKQEIDAGQVKIARLAGLTTVRLEDRILFDSSKTTIKESGMAVLKKVGEALEQIKDKHIQVQGHTDSRPLRWELQEKYPTNWELSAARAATIVRYLIDEVGIDPTRLSAAGYAFHQPLASNDTAEGQQQNRRVEFALLPLRTAPMAQVK